MDVSNFISAVNCDADEIFVPYPLAWIAGYWSSRMRALSQASEKPFVYTIARLHTHTQVALHLAGYLTGLYLFLLSSGCEGKEL